MVATGRQRLLIPQGIQCSEPSFGFPWKQRRGSTTTRNNAAATVAAERRPGLLARFLRGGSRPRRRKILVILAAHCLAAATLAVLPTDDIAGAAAAAAPLLSVFRPAAKMHRALCQDYLHASTPAASGRSLAASARARATSPFASPLPESREGPAVPARTFSSSDRAPLSSTDSTLLRRILSCDTAFSNCSLSDNPDCTAPDPEEDNYDRYPPQDHEPDYDAVLPGGTDNVAYVLPIPKCPPHPEVQATTDEQAVDSSTFYDAFAVVKSATCNCTKENVVPVEGGAEGEVAPVSDYNYTMYGIVHTDAAVCVGSDGTEYDLVKTLQELGFYVEVFDEAVYAGEVASTSPYVAQNADFTDAVLLHAYRLTNHPLAVVIDPTTLMLQPVDELYNALIA